MSQDYKQLKVSSSGAKSRDDYDSYGVHKSSVLKSYERACPSLSSMGKKGSAYYFITASKLWRVQRFHKRWKQVSVPIYSAELHPKNRSQEVSKQLQGFEKALKNENKKLRIPKVEVELLNRYNNLLIDSELGKWSDRTEPRFTLFMKHFPTIPHRFNIGFISWSILLCIGFTYNIWDIIFNVRRASNVTNISEAMFTYGLELLFNALTFGLYLF